MLSEFFALVDQLFPDNFAKFIAPTNLRDGYKQLAQKLYSDVSLRSAGWLPVWATVNDGTRLVRKLTGWQGGQGDAPTVGIGKYEGATGLVDAIADAVDYRGPVGMRWRGAWSSATAYAIADAVTTGSGSWRCKVAHTSADTFDSSNWETLAVGGALPAPRSISALTDAPNYLGEVALFGGRNYRAVSASPVAWLPLASAGFPFTDGSQGQASSANRLTLAQMRDFLVDVQITGAVAGTVYSFTSVVRNSSNWVIALYSQAGTPGTNQLVAQFTVAASPESGTAVTVHTLAAQNSSGITARVAVNWSKIPVGSYNTMWGFSETATLAGYVLHPDCFNTTHFGYLLNLDTQNLQNTIPGVTLANKTIANLAVVPDRVGQTGYNPATGKYYRAVQTSPVAWLPIGSLGFPYTDNSQGGAPGVNRLAIADMRNFIVDLQLTGNLQSNLTYSVPIVIRSGTAWDIQVYSENGSASATQLIARFQASVSPENGTAITVHTLTTQNSSGITGRIAVNWSKLPTGSYYAMFGFSETSSSAGYVLHPDCFTAHFGYLAQYDLNTAIATINNTLAGISSTPKTLTSLSDAPNTVGQIGYHGVTGKYYRAVSVSPVAWVYGDGFPYTAASQGRADLSIMKMRDFLLDLQLVGADTSKVYSLAVIVRGGSSWTLEVYDTGTPNPYALATKFTTTVSPENGTAVTVHTLTAQNSSGITGRVAVNWSKIPVGALYSMWGHTESTGGGFRLHPDCLMPHFGYLAQSDLLAINPEIVASRGARTTLAARLDPVLSPRGLPNTPIWGREKLLRWNSWKRLQDYAFDWAFFGDSYTQGNYYTEYLKNYLLLDGYSNGGAGWCGFSRFSEVVGSINGSIKATELSVSYDLTVWAKTYYAGQLGIDGHITSADVGNQVVVTSGLTHTSITLLFERHSGGAGFRYQLNGGAWTTVSTDNASQATGSVVINTSALAAGFTLTIESLGAGVILFGAIGRRTGNVLTLHKCGLAGGMATNFNASALWATNVANLSLSGAMIMFGTNEQGTGATPAAMATAYQSIIDALRVQNPLIDIVIAMPMYTQYEVEQPRPYSNRDYAIAAFEVAQSKRCAYLDLAQIFGPFSQAQVDAGFFSTDRVHPVRPRGGAAMSDSFYQLLRK